MDFERHREVLDATELGIEANAMRINSVWANMEAGTKTIDPDVLPDFLERLSQNIFPDQLYATYYANLYLKSAAIPTALKLNELRGNYIKYRGKFYKIPNE